MFSNIEIAVLRMTVIGENMQHTKGKFDCEQFLHESVERPTFRKQSCFVTQTNKTTEEGLGGGEKPPSVFLFACVTKDDYLRKAGRSTIL